MEYDCLLRACAEVWCSPTSLKIVDRRSFTERAPICRSHSGGRKDTAWAPQTSQQRVPKRMQSPRLAQTINSGIISAQLLKRACEEDRLCRRDQHPSGLGGWHHSDLAVVGQPVHHLVGLFSRAAGQQSRAVSTKSAASGSAGQQAAALESPCIVWSQLQPMPRAGLLGGKVEGERAGAHPQCLDHLLTQLLGIKLRALLHKVLCRRLELSLGRAGGTGSKGK